MAKYTYQERLVIEPQKQVGIEYLCVVRNKMGIALYTTSTYTASTYAEARDKACAEAEWWADHVIEAVGGGLSETRKRICYSLIKDLHNNAIYSGMSQYEKQYNTKRLALLRRLIRKYGG